MNDQIVNEAMKLKVKQAKHAWQIVSKLPCQAASLDSSSLEPRQKYN